MYFTIQNTYDAGKYNKLIITFPKIEKRRFSVILCKISAKCNFYCSKFNKVTFNFSKFNQKHPFLHHRRSQHRFEFHSCHYACFWEHHCLHLLHQNLHKHCLQRMYYYCQVLNQLLQIFDKFIMNSIK